MAAMTCNNPCQCFNSMLEDGHGFIVGAEPVSNSVQIHIRSFKPGGSIHREVFKESAGERRHSLCRFRNGRCSSASEGLAGAAELPFLPSSSGEAADVPLSQALLPPLSLGSLLNAAADRDVQQSFFLGSRFVLSFGS